MYRDIDYYGSPYKYLPDLRLRPCSLHERIQIKILVKLNTNQLQLDCASKEPKNLNRRPHRS